MTTPTPPGGSPGPGEPGEPARPVRAALARDAERTQRRLESLENGVRELGDKVTVVAAQLATSTPAAGDSLPPGTRPGMRSWLRGGDPERAAADLAELVSWVGRVYLAYPDSALPSCWMWHPDVVEELWWLFQAHVDAYHSVTGSWLRVGDWHDRQRPHVVSRLYPVLANCEPSRHRRDYVALKRRGGHPAADAVGVVAAWMSEGRRDPEPLPPDDPPPLPPPQLPHGRP